MEDVSMDTLLEELASLPLGFDEFEGFPDLNVAEPQQLVGYGDDFGGLPVAKNDTGFYNVIMTSSDRAALPRPTKRQKVNAKAVCKACTLVPAEVRCPDCDLVLCAFCDFETHREKAHRNRVMLEPDAEKNPTTKESEALQNLWKLGGACCAPKPAARESSNTVFERTQSHGYGASLDDTILEFFKTEEFQNVISQVSGDATVTPEAGSCLGLPLYGCDTDDDRAALKVASRPSAKKATPAAQAEKAQLKKEKKEKKEAMKKEKMKMDDYPKAPGNYVFLLGPSKCGEVLLESRATRLAALQRFHAKRIAQRDNPAFRYVSRKKIADNRPRIQGRFVKTEAAVTVTSISA